MNKMLALDVVNLPVFTTATPVTSLSAASAAAAVLNANNKVSTRFFCSFFFVDLCPLLGRLLMPFWISGNVSLGVQNCDGLPYSPFSEGVCYRCFLRI